VAGAVQHAQVCAERPQVLKVIMLLGIGENLSQVL
jgi:hypothetical protein